MAKAPKPKRGHAKKPEVRSGAVGGPSTGTGVNFQVDIAIVEAIELVSETLVNPLADARIWMEPRILSGEDTATRWDIGASRPSSLSEVKLDATREDVLEWLRRAGSLPDSDMPDEIRLYYGRGAVPIIGTVESLSRIAREAGGDVQRFTERVEFERVKDADLVLNALPKNAQQRLVRLVFVPFDQPRLKRDIQHALRHLVHEPHRQQLYDLLFRKLHKGIECRLEFQVSDITAEVDAAGIHLIRPPTFVPAELSEPDIDAAYLLQACEIGLPIEVVAAASGVEPAKLEARLATHQDRGIFGVENGLLMLRPVRTRIFRDSGAEVAGKALSQLLEYITANKENKLGWSQVPNAIALAKCCGTEQRELVAGLFRKLDKLLKRTGNKRLVLEVANMSINAARIEPRTQLQAEGEAVALICGRSWVYQRTGRLQEARAEGEKSLHIGEGLGWKRNTGFCLKCLGRLFRLEAIDERRAGKYEMAAEKLRQSVDYLKRAIDYFSANAAEIGPDANGEVGDSHSLLARTHLQAGDLQLAAGAARVAVELLTNPSSKDYADLQIVLGDLELAGRRPDAAVSYFDEAIEVAKTTDVEKSEIAARAWFQKGVATKQRACFDNAATIWRSLDEVENAALAEWESLVLEGTLPPRTAQLLDRETGLVRVEALRLHKARLSAAAPSRGRRADPGDNYWIALVEQAKRNVTVRHADW